MAGVRVAIVGGGITGLAAAHRLLEQGVERSAIVVLESDDRLGGQIRTERHGDLLLEAGPDTLVAQKPAAVALCERLGLGGDLETAAGGGTEILLDGRLVPVPQGFLMMAPTSRRAVLGSPLFTWKGKLRMLAEPWVKPRPAALEDESLASFVTRRFGREALDRVAEPVVASLFTADAERLSLRMTMPRFLDLEAEQGSVTPALRRGVRRPFGHGTGRGGFVSVRGGLERIVEALAERLEGCIRTRSRVVRVSRSGDGPWTLTLAGGETIAADALLLACPAFAAARALSEHDPALAEDLSVLRYAPCATVNLVYRREAVRGALASLGFFVPRVEGAPILACSYVSEKFSGRAPRELVVLRVFLGGATRPGIVEGDDDALIRVAHDALRPVLAIEGEPVLARVHRFPRAMPQFDVGAVAWVERVRARAASHAGLEIAGSVMGAVGLPDCIRSGEEAATRLASRMAALPAIAASP